MTLANRDEMEIAGQYNPNTRVIDVHCVLDEVRTNNILLHETKHYIDDANGTLPEGQRAMRAAVNRTVAGIVGGGIVVAGVLAATKIGEPTLGATTVIPGLPMMYRAYWKAPHEVDARNFAKDPAILQKFGGVISYD